MSDTSTTTDPATLRDLATVVVSAYVASHHMPAAELPGLIATVHGALSGLATGDTMPAVEEVEKPTPAQIRKSITPDALISFLDGKPYKTLKRHLGLHGLDGPSYRARFGLPADYPLTSPNYSARRSELAKQMGLGVQRQQAAE